MKRYFEDCKVTDKVIDKFINLKGYIVGIYKDKIHVNFDELPYNTFVYSKDGVLLGKEKQTLFYLEDKEKVFIDDEYICSGCKTSLRIHKNGWSGSYTCYNCGRT